MENYTSLIQIKLYKIQFMMPNVQLQMCKLLNCPLFTVMQKILYTLFSQSLPTVKTINFILIPKNSGHQRTVYV